MTLPTLCKRGNWPQRGLSNPLVSPVRPALFTSGPVLTSTNSIVRSIPYGMAGWRVPPCRLPPVKNLSTDGTNELGAASCGKATMRRGALIGQGKPKAHGRRRGFQNRGWRRALQGFQRRSQNSLNGVGSQQGGALDGV
jgi:hypothetical protein